MAENEQEEMKEWGPGDIKLFKGDLKAVENVIKDKKNELISLMESYIEEPEIDDLFYALEAAFNEKVDRFFRYFLMSPYQVVMKDLKERNANQDTIENLKMLYTKYGFKMYNRSIIRIHPRYIKSMITSGKYGLKGETYFSHRLKLVNGETFSFEGTANGSIYLAIGLLSPLVDTQKNLKAAKIETKLQYEDIKKLVAAIKELEKILKK